MISGIASSRRGFALLVVMVILAGSAGVGMESIHASEMSFESSRNRVALVGAYWAAQGCIEQLREEIGSALRADSAKNNAWLRIDSIAQQVSLTGGCRLVAQPSGIAVDIDSVSDDQLRRILVAGNHSNAQIDTMLDALHDWIDPDTTPRSAGAERAWYRAAHRPEPRNGPLASIQELRLIRGFEGDTEVERLLDVESSRLLVDRAPLSLLALLPGMTDEALTAIAELRAVGKPVGDLAIFANGLTSEARASFLSHYAEIVARTSPVPEWWTVWSESTRGEPPVSEEVEVRLVLSGHEAAVVRCAHGPETPRPAPRANWDCYPFALHLRSARPR